MKQNSPTEKADRRTTKRKIGDLGENIACRFLMKHGFTILNRNYLKKWGEIDIIAQKDTKLHFVEVKTVSHLPFSRETTDSYRPEDNVHFQKLRRLNLAIQSYLAEIGTISQEDVSRETDWQIDLITVYVDLAAKRQFVDVVDNIY